MHTCSKMRQVFISSHDLCFHIYKWIQAIQSWPVDSKESFGLLLLPAFLVCHIWRNSSLFPTYQTPRKAFYMQKSHLTLTTVLFDGWFYLSLCSPGLSEHTAFPLSLSLSFFCLLRAASSAHGRSQARVESELQLPAYATATAVQDPSCVCNLHHSSQQSWTRGPLIEARDLTCILMDPRWGRYRLAMMGTPIPHS